MSRTKPKYCNAHTEERNDCRNSTMNALLTMNRTSVRYGSWQSSPLANKSRPVTSNIFTKPYRAITLLLAAVSKSKVHPARNPKHRYIFNFNMRYFLRTSNRQIYASALASTTSQNHFCTAKNRNKRAHERPKTEGIFVY